MLADQHHEHQGNRWSRVHRARDILIHHMRVDPDTLVYHSQVANLGAFMAGSSSNGLHCANALAALFIATGQDVANVAGPPPG